MKQTAILACFTKDSFTVDWDIRSREKVFIALLMTNNCFSNTFMHSLCISFIDKSETAVVLSMRSLSNKCKLWKIYFGLPTLGFLSDCS